MIGVRFRLQSIAMSSQKLSKAFIIVALIAVACSVVGYVFVVVADYTDCERIEAAELKKGNKVSCRDVKAKSAVE
jgi:flagellar basal body-associated protein FliL